MAKHLTANDVEVVVNLIRGWNEGKLTWDAICDSSAQLIGKRPSRQSLNANQNIKDAYLAKKKGHKVGVSKPSQPSSLEVASQRIDNLQAKVYELEEKNRVLLERLVKWQYNAYKYGLQEHQLNEPLPNIDRERTETK